MYSVLCFFLSPSLSLSFSSSLLQLFMETSTPSGSVALFVPYVTIDTILLVSFLYLYYYFSVCMVPSRISAHALSRTQQGPV
uniref:Secreted protein n=1 Tax=Anopheles darlingi TaxID=43151 RepID=A0A2M4D716_ANODA